MRNTPNEEEPKDNSKVVQGKSEAVAQETLEWLKGKPASRAGYLRDRFSFRGHRLLVLVASSTLRRALRGLLPRGKVPARQRCRAEERA